MKRPGDYVDVKIVEPLHVHEHWPSYVSGAEHFGTMSFEHEIMRELIEFGWFPVHDPERPWVRTSFGPMLDAWMDVVPQCYREKVVEIVRAVFERSFKNDVYRPHHLDLFVEEVRNAIWSQLEPVPPRGCER